MSVLDLARIIIYRFHEKGLEIFLLDDYIDDQELSKLPIGFLDKEDAFDGDHTINLDTQFLKDGKKIKAYAIEGEWHDIPSVRKLIKSDVKLVKHKIKEVLPESEKGGYYAVKEAFKKLMPEEYKAVKELKDILTDRNLTKYI